MLIDHIGFIFFPDLDLLRVIGRIAFPLYAYGIALGYRRTRNVRRYLFRLAALAGISQIPYMIAFQWERINVIGTFAACLIVMMLLDRFKGNGPAAAIVGLAGAALLEWLPFEYGAYCLALVLMFRYVPRDYWLLVHGGLNVVYFVYHGWWVQLFSIIPTMLVVLGGSWLEKWDRKRVPRWLWLSFYPGHLALLALAGFWWYGGDYGVLPWEL